MKRFAILLLLLTGAAQAQTITAVDVTNLADGTFVLTKKAGAVTLVPLRLVQPSSNPDDPTPPTTQTPFEREVSRLTSAALSAGGTPTTAAGISSVYSLVSDSVASGSTPPDKAIEGVGFLIGKLLASQSDRDKWAVFRTSLGDALDTLRQDGSLNTGGVPDKAKYTRVLKEIANGMNFVTGFNGSLVKPGTSSADNAGLFGNIDFAKLIELIKMLLELWKTFMGGAN